MTSLERTRPELRGISGVYAVVHRITGKTYVGATINLEKRRATHATRSGNKWLHEDIERDGAAAFDFKVIQLCTDAEIFELESLHIKKLAIGNGYNRHGWGPAARPSITCEGDIDCPICKKRVTATHFACNSGSKGGKAKGATKARTSEQASAAVAHRWTLAARANAKKPRKKKEQSK